MSRRRAWPFVARSLAIGLTFFGPSGVVSAQVSLVPPEIQAALLAKLETYDRNFAARAGALAKVLILVRPGNSKSELSGADMSAALARIDLLGGLPHQEVVVAYPGAAALAQRCRAEHVAVVYVTPGFDDELDPLRAAFTPANVLTLAAVAEYVPRGIVLGFQLESGKPKIVINLDQAKTQGVNFPTDLLRLMKVYR